MPLSPQSLKLNNLTAATGIHNGGGGGGGVARARTGAECRKKGGVAGFPEAAILED